MFNPLSLLTGWQSYALTAAATALLVIPTTVWTTSQSYKVEIANMKATYADQQKANAETAIAQYTKQAHQMNISAIALMKALPEYKDKFDQIEKDFKNVSQEKPLPVACRPTADRLRILTAAVAAANATAFGD